MNQHSIFRHQAVVSQQHKIDGNILVKPRLSAIILTSLIVCWLSGVISWLISGRYSYTQTVTGWLEPQNGLTHVYTPDPGAIVTTVLVSENQFVSKGTPLIRLSRDAIFNNNQSMNETLVNELSGQIERLQAQYQLTQTNFQNQRSRLLNAAKRLTEDRTSLQTMRTLLNQKAALLKRQTTALSKLAKDGFYSQHQLENLNAQQLDEDYQRQQLEREWLTVSRAIEDNRFELEQSGNLREQELLSLENQISELQKSLNLQYSTQDVIVTAPADGTVTRLHVKNGQTSQASLPLLTLIPQGSEIAAQLLIPVSAAGQISAGQTISLRYDAFPYTQFGTYEAVIDKVSPHLLLPQEVAQTPLALTAPVYLASARIVNTSIHYLNQTFALRAGMTFAAEITVRERNLMQWLFEPLYELSGGAA